MPALFTGEQAVGEGGATSHRLAAVRLAAERRGYTFSFQRQLSLFGSAHQCLISHECDIAQNVGVAGQTLCNAVNVTVS